MSAVEAPVEVLVLPDAPANRLYFRSLPAVIHRRGLKLALLGVAGPSAAALEVLRLAAEIGLRAMESAVSPLGAEKGVLRLCRQAGAVVPAEPIPFALAPVPADVPAAIREIVAEVREGGGAAGVLRAPLGSPRAVCRRCRHVSRSHSEVTRQCLVDGCECAGFMSLAARVPKVADPSAVRYADFYSRGILDAARSETWVLSPADSRSIGATIGPALAAHARDSSGAPIVGELLLTWLWDAARLFRRETADRADFWGGWSPRHFVRWLNTRSSAPKGTAQPAPGRTFGKGAR